MIRKEQECKIEYREHMRDGDGTVQITNFGCSIGYHLHDKDAELFYIIKGTAEYNDNGVIRTVTAGDVTICPTGESHGIANKTDEVVELAAVIVYA